MAGNHIVEHVWRKLDVPTLEGWDIGYQIHGPFNAPKFNYYFLHLISIQRPSDVLDEWSRPRTNVVERNRWSRTDICLPYRNITIASSRSDSFGVVSSDRPSQFDRWPHVHRIELILTIGHSLWYRPRSRTSYSLRRTVPH